MSTKEAKAKRSKKTLNYDLAVCRSIYSTCITTNIALNVAKPGFMMINGTACNSNYNSCVSRAIYKSKK
jgi:hypothetical protein